MHLLAPGSPVVESIRKNLAHVMTEVSAAAARVRRRPEEVRIVAVTKTFPSAVVAAALDAGLADIGENYVQEARTKREELGARGRWHLIGGLQRNKVRAAIGLFDWVHSVDSEELARALDQELGRAGRRMPVCLQVNVAEESAKRGVPPAALPGLAERMLGLSHLEFVGLMTVPPAGGGEASRPHFRCLRELRDQTAIRLGVEFPHLSMGMSSDFAVAVEEGATLLRLGRVLFGARAPRTLEGP